MQESGRRVFVKRDLADVGRKTTYLGIAATKCRADNPLREEGIIS
jgi:hypothetical protein